MLPALKSRLEKFKRFIGWSSDSSPNHDDMQKKCLEIYLSAPRKVICDYELSSAQLNIVQVGNVASRLFLQLYRQKIHQYQTKDWISDQLPKVSSIDVLYEIYIVHHLSGNGWMVAFAG